ncbi:MAG TPA: DUF6311 domain-containing protein [Vicinamibacterales bacterium]
MQLRPAVERGGTPLWTSALAAAAIAAIIAYNTLDAQFLHGTGGKWLQPDNDSAAYMVAWSYFLGDAWRLPIFAVPRMGYPEGGNVLFLDALPLTAIVTKCVYAATRIRLNPYGPWNLLTYLLQGAFAARLLYAAGARSLPAALAGAVLLVCTTSFMWRMQHTAISSHFLILWALALYFESRRGSRRLVEMWVLASLALLINSYLFAMVIALHAVTLLATIPRDGLPWRDVRTMACGAAAVVAIALASGYGVLFTNPSSMQAMGFGLFSWNLAGLLVPRSFDVVRDATGGQYEGEAYIGMGALIVVTVALVSRPAATARHVRTHAWLVALLAACAIYAASNRVYAGSTLVLSYDVPARVESLASFFRATGRFIWPVAYSVVALSLACVFRWWRPAIAIPIAALAVVVQLTEVRPYMRYFKVTTGRALASAIDAARVDEWVRTHDRIWQYPSWSCGGLSGSKVESGSLEANRELQIQLLAARAGTPMNSIYTSRMLKHCDREFEWGAHPRFEEGVLYLLSWKTAAETPAIATLVASGPCIGLSWGIACSTRFRAAPAPADAQPSGGRAMSRGARSGGNSAGTRPGPVRSK